MVYYTLAFESDKLTGTDESLVNCYKKTRWSKDVGYGREKTTYV